MAEEIHIGHTNIPNGITAEHIKKAAKDYENGDIEHRFINSIKYDVIIDGKRYPPKAIIGLASRYIIGHVLTPADFSGGIGTTCFNVLQNNGFPFVLKSNDIVYPDEVNEDDVHVEGSVTRVVVNRYERDKDARDKCIEYYGLNCSVCNFNFGEVYGELGVGFIHVHHLMPIANIGQEYHIDPIKDLRPVCPNCHAMLHKRKEPYSIDELKALIN